MYTNAILTRRKERRIDNITSLSSRVNSVIGLILTLLVNFLRRTSFQLNGAIVLLILLLRLLIRLIRIALHVNS